MPVKDATRARYARYRAKAAMRKHFTMVHNSKTRIRRAAKPAPLSRPTLKDVALRCGVHPSTVSRALSPAMRHLVAPDVA